MSDKNNKEDSPLKIYYPTVDQIYIETDSKLKTIEGWEEWKIDCNDVYSEILKKYDPIGWSKEFFMILIFYNYIQNNTDLFIDTLPEEPAQPEDNEVSPNKIQGFKTDFDNYINCLKGWHSKLIDLAPKALEEFSSAEELDVRIEINPGIEYSGEDPRRFKNIAFSSEREEDWDSAIEYQKKYYQAVNEYPENYPNDECDIYDLRRLPIYLYKGGYIEEAWEEFSKLIRGEYPVKKSELSTLESKILETIDLSLIYASMRNLCIKEKRYKEAFILRCLDLYFFNCSSYFMSKVKDPNEFIYFISERFFEDWDSARKSFRRIARSLRANYARDIKTRARMAKVENVSQITEVLVDATKILPDYNSGEKMIIEMIRTLTNNEIFPHCEKGKTLKKKKFPKKKYTDSNWEWND